MQALLIIDMQKCSFRNGNPRPNEQKVVSHINQLAKKFRANSLPVIFIQHDGTGSSVCEKGAVEWELLDDLIIEEMDLFIDKTANDVFYKSKLLSVLKAHNVSKVIVTGDATDFCVEASIQSALAKDFEVVVIEDAHSTGNRPHANAETIIAHYNWVWNNMLPTNGSVKTVSCNQFLETCI